MPQYNFDIAGPHIDRDSLFELVLEASFNMPYMNVVPSEASIKSYIDFYCNADLSKHVCFLMQEGTRVVGMLVANMSTAHPIMQGVPVAHEIVWFVSKNHRGKASLALIPMFEQWAKSMGATHAVMSHFEDETGRVLEKVYLSKGYKPVEHSYMKEIK